jgi:hypothetical protein
MSRGSDSVTILSPRDRYQREAAIHSRKLRLLVHEVLVEDNLDAVGLFFQKHKKYRLFSLRRFQ